MECVCIAVCRYEKCVGGGFVVYVCGEVRTPEAYITSIVKTTEQGVYECTRVLSLLSPCSQSPPFPV